MLFYTSRFSVFGLLSFLVEMFIAPQDLRNRCCCSFLNFCLFLFKYICMCLLACMCIPCMVVTIKSRKEHKNSFNCSYRALLTTEYENVGIRNQNPFFSKSSKQLSHFSSNFWSLCLILSPTFWDIWIAHH